MIALARRHRAILLAYAGMLVLLLLTNLFSPGFLSPSHLRSIFVLAAFVGIVAIGQTFVIIGGGIDLSVPWVLNCAAVLVTLLAHSQNGPLVWAIPLLLITGALVGAANGLGIALFGVPPIIMTLAVTVILQGGILVYTGGSPPGMTPELIRFLAVGRLWSGRRSPRSPRSPYRRRRSAASSTRLGQAAAWPSFPACPLCGSQSPPIPYPASPRHSRECCSPATAAKRILVWAILTCSLPSQPWLSAAPPSWAAAAIMLERSPGRSC
jgi:hypothetical protein